MNRTEQEMSILKDKFITMFSVEDEKTLISFIADKTRSRLSSTTTETQAAELIIELKAIKHLQRLFQDWRNSEIKESNNE